ncbi:MAG: serine/threonine-protein kinase [Verrucomicrobiota bacterium]
MPESVEEIASCHACGSPMDVTAVAPFAKVECPSCGAHTRVKCKFGPYTLLRRHAIGGMSVVFVAHDDILNREVAVKILNESYSADARRIAAFEEEACITASFSHPHVVRVFTTGRAFERFFIAMELVVGGHFEHQINVRGTIPEREMLPLAIQVAEGLKAALAAGLIHRDIKPGNILLDGDGNAKIVDFGLALLLDKSGTVQAQEIWATPYYVPPETIEGDPEDFRSDMYAFGATLYHALAGRPSCNEESMATNILRDAKRKVVPLHSAASWITPQTCAVVERAMAYEPDQRFQSYDEMIARLNDALKQLRTGATSQHLEPAGSKRRQSGKRRAERLLTVVGVAASLVVLAGGAWWMTRNPLKPAAKPVAPLVDTTLPTDPAEPLNDPADATRIMQLYREARGALENGNYHKAGELFGSLRDDAAGQEPTRTWAGVEAVVMSYLDGKPAKARKEAKVTAAHITAAQLDDPSIKPLLLPTLENLDTLPPIAADANGLAGGGTPQAMAWLLSGLKNWEQGQLTEAADFFTAVSTAKLEPQDIWATYQKIAGDYLTDFKALSNPVFDKLPVGRNACERALKELTSIHAELKTRGRAPFNVTAWKRDVEKQARQPAPPEAAESPDHNPPPAPTGPATLATVLETLARYANVCNFQDATSYLESLPADPAGASRKALLELTNCAVCFIRDLTTELRHAEVNVDGRLKTGDAFAKISAIDTAGKVLVTLPSGRARDCEWGDIAPASIIEIYRLLIKNETQEKVRLRGHECAIAFEWLAGDRVRALSAAEQLAPNPTFFKGRWKDLVKGLPK